MAAEENPRLTPELEQTLRRYVAGDLDEAVRSELEERLVTEPDVFEALGVVEDELIEEYLDGLGTPAERQAFEKGFLTSPRRAERLRFARTLRTGAARAAQERSPARPGRTWGPSRPSQPAFLGLAAALVLSLATNLWFVSHPSQARQAAGGPPPSVPATAVEQRPGPRVVAAPAVGGVEPEGAVERERDGRRQAESRAAALEVELRRARTSVASFALAAGALRAASGLQKIVVASDAAVVELRLELPAADYARYRAVLLDDTGAELVVAGRLQARDEPDAARVTLLVDARALPRGDYQVRLTGQAEDGGEEVVGSYPFRLERR